jgi:hypothetical protein
LEQRLDLIVIAQERNKQIIWPVLEYETKRYIAATFEKFLAEFPNSQATVDVRLAKRLR